LERWSFITTSTHYNDSDDVIYDEEGDDFDDYDDKKEEKD
jgi:hypothetical protein